MRTWVSGRVYTFLRFTQHSFEGNMLLFHGQSAVCGKGLRRHQSGGASSRPGAQGGGRGFPSRHSEKRFSLNSFCPIFQSKSGKFLVKDASSSRQ